MNKKHYYLILDTETANGLYKPLCYDIGFTIIDRKGKVYERRSFIVKEIFDDTKLMSTAYYADKVPMYEREIERKRYYKMKLSTIKQKVESLLKKYNIKEMYAYNCGFDKRALKNTNDRLLNDLYGFFFRDIIYNCIWNMACQVICNNRNYRKFCKDNNYISSKGFVKTSAEVVYRYITKNIGFMESHTGLADSEIESKILQEIWKKHKKVDKTINSACWKIPQEQGA